MVLLHGSNLGGLTNTFSLAGVYSSFQAPSLFCDGPIWPRGEPQPQHAGCGTGRWFCSWRLHKTEEYLSCRHAEVHHSALTFVLTFRTKCCFMWWLTFHPVASYSHEGTPAFVIRLWLEWLLKLLSFQNKTADVQPVLWDGSAASCRYITVYYFHYSVFLWSTQSINFKFLVTGKSKRPCSTSDAEREL